MPFRLVSDDSNCLVGTDPPLTVVVCRTQMSPATVDTIADCVETMAGARGGNPDRELQPVGLMIVMAPGSRPPQGEARERINTWTREYGDLMINVGVSVVIEATGLWGSALRVAASTIALANRARYPQDIFATIEDALAFHAGVAGAAPTGFAKALAGHRAAATRAARGG